MHDDRVEADIFQEHDILGELLFQRRIGHRMTAILDDHRLSLEGANVGQGFDQDVGFLNQSVHE
jgi:transposase